MTLKTFKPTTPGTRGLIQISRIGLWKGKPEKTLVKGKINLAGRNNYGRKTSRHKGGGHKKLYRMVDFKRAKHDVPAIVERIEYDPNRTAFIAFVKYEDGTLSYILAPEKLSIGDKIISGENVDIKVGNALPLSNIPIGSLVHNIELRPGKGGQIIRAAGSAANIVGKDSGYTLVKLRSGEVRLVLSRCYATIGELSNPDQKNINLGKAGRNRWRGKRPHVRGVAMNPVDHPHGGGEGKTSGGRHPVDRYGNPTKGKKTRRNKRTDKFIVTKRRG